MTAPGNARPEGERGYLHVYTGDGKGKTTCAIGLAIRSVGAGNSVAILQFDKGFEGKNEHYHERFALRTIPQIELFFYGMERMMANGKFRFANIPDDLEQARAGLVKARELIAAGQHQLIILDEAVTCVGTKLYSENDLLDLVDFFKQQGKCELVLTGRGAFEKLIDQADLVSEVKLIKHYFYNGVQARKGVEF